MKVLQSFEKRGCERNFFRFMKIFLSLKSFNICSMKWLCKILGSDGDETENYPIDIVKIFSSVIVLFLEHFIDAQGGAGGWGYLINTSKDFKKLGY